MPLIGGPLDGGICECKRPPKAIHFRDGEPTGEMGDSHPAFIGLGEKHRGYYLSRDAERYLHSDMVR